MRLCPCQFCAGNVQNALTVNEQAGMWSLKNEVFSLLFLDYLSY